MADRQRVRHSAATPTVAATPSAVGARPTRPRGFAWRKAKQRGLLYPRHNTWRVRPSKFVGGRKLSYVGIPMMTVIIVTVCTEDARWVLG